MLIPNLPLASIVDNLESAGSLTGWNTGQFIAQCVGITVLFVTLNLFAWKPVCTILDQRRKTIEDAMANAEKIKRELADAEASRLSILQKANEQAAAIIAQAEKAAVTRGEQKTQEAARQAEDIIKKAHEAAVLDHQRLLSELKREVGALVIQTTEKVAGKVLTPDDQNRLNAETLQQLRASSN
jgi:F-type H+-transporting ATPase subunit b